MFNNYTNISAPYREPKLPPPDFIPYSLIVNGGCARCDVRLSDGSNLIEHKKIAHGGEIKKHIRKKPWKMFLKIKNTMNG